MFGTFQQSHLRIEINATATDLAQQLLYPQQLKTWLAPQQFVGGLPDKLTAGCTFTSSLGFITINHQVDIAEANHLRLLLSKGVDGFHEWYWGDGWVQSRLEGVSILPLKVAQAWSLMRLRSQFPENPTINTAEATSHSI